MVNFAHGPIHSLSSGAAHPAVGSFVAHVAFHVNKSAHFSSLLEGETCRWFLDSSIDWAASVFRVRSASNVATCRVVSFFSFLFYN